MKFTATGSRFPPRVRAAGFRTRHIATVAGNATLFALTFLGTSASVPSAERNHPGLLIEAGSQRILVDCGEGTQRQLLRGGAGFRRLDRLLLTHGHFDHVLGIPGLFSTLRLRRSADLMTI
jgi:ribonuclease Z